MANTPIYPISVIKIEVGGELEFAGEVSEHTLEEGVDGLHAEVVVVVEQVGKGDACSLADETVLIDVFSCMTFV